MDLEREEIDGFALASVIIVTRNRCKDVLDCVHSVSKSTYRPLEIIVVDNASTDETSTMLPKVYPNVLLVSNKANLGLAAGRNVGQSIARGKYLVFLDSDTVVDSGMISHLVGFATDPMTGIVAPKMYGYFEPKRIWFAGAKIDMLSSRARNIGVNEIDVGNYDQVRTISHAPTCFLVKRELAELIGGHDSLFFQSYADADFAFRLADLGYINRYVPKAILYHKVPPPGQSRSLRSLGIDTPLRAYYYARNKILFMKRHAPRKQFVVFMLIFMPVIAVGYVEKITRYGGGWKYVSPYLAGLKDGVSTCLRGT
jgi:GT2 family glycosyltransferase